MKTRVTTSETAREMCADENEDLVEKACLYLFDGRYLRVVPATKKKKSHQKKGLTLRDGEVFYKPPKNNSTGQKVNIHSALYGIHALMTSIKQEV